MPLVIMEDRNPTPTEARRLSRLHDIQNNVRSMLQGIGSSPASSLYSRSPNAQQTPHQPMQDAHYGPKSPPARELFGLMPRTGETPFLRQTPSFHLPFNARANATYSPVTAPSEWARQPNLPSPVAQSTFRHPSDEVPMIDEVAGDIEAALPPRGTKRRKPQRKRRRQNHWTRKRKTQSGSRTCAAVFQGPTRIKLITTIISGLFLASILTIYISIALTVKNLGQELHILFILFIIASLIFFTHSLIRLILLTFRPNRKRRNNNQRPAIPSVAGPEGFKPNIPIPVALARDDLAFLEEDGMLPEEKLEALKQPPPAYGLWRCSVRIDPNLLHWQRANGIHHQNSLPDQHSPVAFSPMRSESSPVVLPSPAPQESTVRRPPSYVSEDGISYVVSALPGRPPSEIHPALRIRLP